MEYILTDKFFLLHVYTPNSGEELKRLDYRTKTWDKVFRKKIIELPDFLALADLFDVLAFFYY